MDWPESGALTLKGIKAKAVSAVYLVNGKKADFVQKGDVLKLTLSAESLNEYDTVVKVTF